MRRSHTGHLNSPIVAVQGHVQYRGVILEDVLCAVPMMDVPVQNDDAPGSLGLSSSCCYGCVVEKAKPHGHPTLSMMTCHGATKRRPCKVMEDIIGF